MTLGPQDYALVGSQGVALVVYKLRMMGIPAQEAGEGLSFDVLAFPGDRVVRIQSKATQVFNERGGFTFSTHKGRWSKDLTNSRPQSVYTANEVDLIALAALPIEAVMFRPASGVGKRTRVSRSKFSENVEKTSWELSVEQLDL